MTLQFFSLHFFVIRNPSYARKSINDHTLKKKIWLKREHTYVVAILCVFVSVIGNFPSSYERREEKKNRFDIKLNVLLLHFPKFKLYHHHRHQSFCILNVNASWPHKKVIVVIWLLIFLYLKIWCVCFFYKRQCEKKSHCWPSHKKRTVVAISIKRIYILLDWFYCFKKNRKNIQRMVEKIKPPKKWTDTSLTCQNSNGKMNMGIFPIL